MNLNLITPPNFIYKPLFIALISCVNMHAYATMQEEISLPETASEQSNNPSNISSDNSEISNVSLSKSNLLLENHTPPKGVRMGEWLQNKLEEKQIELYEPSLAWHSSTEVQPQREQQQLLIQSLNQLVAKNINIQPLVAWIDNLSATGRVILPKQDPRYLQVNPNLDPVFETGDMVKTPDRRDLITVIFDDAKSCRIEYKAGVRAKDYIDKCKISFNKNYKADKAYVILPDGTVEQVSIAKWNAKQQQAPVAGSWLWVPSSANKWPQDLEANVARFLATQGVDLTLPDGHEPEILQLSNMNSEKSRDLPVSASDWGVSGLLQTPTARMQKQGYGGGHISYVDPYTQYNVILQPFDWLETAVRYTNFKDIPYALNPTEDNKDKSLDVKFKLLKESQWLPEVAVGLRDPAGTGIFSGEYLVANKRYADFDFSLGMGWGYLGARGNIDNPLVKIDDRFDSRDPGKVGQGGKFKPESWFTGPVSLFGGVQWHTPYDPLTVKIEYDGNDYKSERYSKEKFDKTDSPVNIGLTWQDKLRGIAFSAGYERGDTMMVSLTLQGDLSELGRIKPKASQVSIPEKLSTSGFYGSSYQINLGGSNEKLNKKQLLLSALSQSTGWTVNKLSFDNGVVVLNVEGFGGAFVKERIEQAMQIIGQVLPADSKLVAIQITRNDEPVGLYKIDPATWMSQHHQLLPPSKRVEQLIQITASKDDFELVDKSFTVQNKLPKGSIRFSPQLQLSFGGPDGFLYGLYADATANYKLWQGAWVNGTVQARLADNYENYIIPGSSNLPQVRTNIRNYIITSNFLMPNLQWTQFKKLDDNLYGLAYAGYLESMYAGVGGEVLYRKPNKPWAVGFDINRVRQRDFDQHFGLQDYEVTTGHLNLYWNTPWQDVDMKLSAGQYLAGDKGATLDLSRTFNNGVKMGGWITKTDVSDEDFGEGSMDKGVYVSLPLDTVFKSWSPGVVPLVYQPLVRDGGAKLGRRYQLYDLTSPVSGRTLEIENPKKY